ncbi:MAG: hypothetical protein EA421_02575 [Gemmatimonadales bacterium]|jgi:hypothetical protein|nr:MAG: hypothetical protein EA421_02575 [Gemmatimonadales bacterium]
MPLSTRIPAPFLALGLALMVGACGNGDVDPPADAPMEAAEAVHPQDAFLANLAALCGRAFAGEATLASSDDFDDGLIMHIRRCDEDEIQIPLHAGENRSRTWIITRTEDGLRLKHDHRLEDGSDDPVTQYGGDTTSPGTPLEQSFPADAFTAELLPEAATNVWNMTLVPGERFIYHLTRHGEPRATFEFDLTQEVDPPPPPWGYEGT